MAQSFQVAPEYVDEIMTKGIDKYRRNQVSNQH